MMNDRGKKIDNFNRFLIMNNLSPSDFWDGDLLKKYRFCKLDKMVLTCRCKNDYKILLNKLNFMEA